MGVDIDGSLLTEILWQLRLINDDRHDDLYMYLDRFFKVQSEFTIMVGNNE